MLGWFVGFIDVENLDAHAQLSFVADEEILNANVQNL
jgi:hypothetical protein